jgi:hypothetical protein
MAVSPKSSEVLTKTATKEIREWAVAEGREISSRVRISADIKQAFYDAQAKNEKPKKIQEKPARTKNVAAKKTGARKAAPKKAAVKSAPAVTATVQKITATKPVADRTAATRGPSKSAATSKASAKKTTKDIREWALGEGLAVSARGRISAEIVQAFHDAHAVKVQANAAPVKKTAAKKTAAKKTVAKSAPVTMTTAVKKAPAKKTPVTKAAAKPAAEKTAATRAPSKRAAAAKAPVRKSTKEIREWALGEGRVVSSRGRISAEIEQAFYDAQAKVSAA